MAMTLADAEKLSNDILLKGVLETIITTSEILGGPWGYAGGGKKALPFIDITGNGLTYNVEATTGTANFYSVGDTWTESTPTTTQRTAGLKTLGGDADVDKFLQKTRSNINDLTAWVVSEKAKAVAMAFDEYFIYGDVATNPKAFDGLHKLAAAGLTHQVHAGTTTTGAAGSIAKLRKLIRLIKPGKPDALIMNAETRDWLSDYASRNESPIRFTVNEFGLQVPSFNGIPFIIDDYITQTETIASDIYALKTGGACTSIFAVKWGEGNVVGCQNGGVETDYLGELETKRAKRVRIAWDCSLACMNDLSLAVYDGVTAAAWGA